MNAAEARELGGPGRDRTDDLFHAMEARSQLRHRPTWWKNQQVNSRLHGIDSQTGAHNFVQSVEN